MTKVGRSTRNFCKIYIEFPFPLDLVPQILKTRKIIPFFLEAAEVSVDKVDLQDKASWAIGFDGFWKSKVTKEKWLECPVCPGFGDAMDGDQATRDPRSMPRVQVLLTQARTRFLTGSHLQNVSSLEQHAHASRQQPPPAGSAD